MEISLQQIDSTIAQAAITEITVNQGDLVSQGDIIAEIETDKASLSLQCPCDGEVLSIIAKTGQTINSDTVFMVVGQPSERPADEDIQSLKQALAEVSNRVDSDNDSSKSLSSESYDNMPAHTADLSSVKLGDIIKLSRLQKMTGDLMVKSKQQIPCFYLTTEVDAGELIEVRKKANADSNIKISYNDFIIKAMAIGIEKYPLMGGKLGKDEIIINGSINIALAVAAGDDLFAPVIRDVGSKTVSQIAAESADLVSRAKTFSLTPEQLQSGCCALTNLGAFGIDNFIPIVIPGQCFILGIGAINPSPMLIKGDLLNKSTFKMTISIDHRIVNGAYGAQFLDFVKKTLENPQYPI